MEGENDDGRLAWQYEKSAVKESQSKQLEGLRQSNDEDLWGVGSGKSKGTLQGKRNSEQILNATSS